MDTNGIFNNGFNYGGIPQGTGAQFNGYGFNNQPTIRKNVLTNEEIQSLMKQENNFSLSITSTDALRANCNHRMADGIHDSLYEDTDGTVTCSICGYKFRPLSANTSIESIQASVDEIIDVLQTIKLLWVNINGEAAREYFPMIAMLEKVPKLFEIAAKDFNKNGNNPWGYNASNMSTIQLFNMLSGMMNGVTQPMGAMPQQQPMMGQPQPPFGGYNAAPMMNPVFASNGFGYVPNPNMPGYQPTTDVNGFQTQYGAQVPPTINTTAQEVPAADKNVTPEANTVKA